MLLSEHVIHEPAAELARRVLIMFEEIAISGDTRLSESDDGDRTERGPEAGEFSRDILLRDIPRDSHSRTKSRCT